MAKVADGEVDAQTHLSSHNDEGNVPSQRCDNKEKCTTSLQKMLDIATMVSRKEHQLTI